MSGLKYSEIRLKEETKACQNARAKINTLISIIEGLNEKAGKIFNEIPQGVKESFPAEIQKIRSWQLKEMPQISSEMNSSQLNSIVEKLQRIDKEGRKALQMLIEIKEVKREAKARELISRQESLRVEFNGMEHLLNKWRAEEYEKIVGILEKLSLMIEQGGFIETERVLNQSIETLARLRQEVTSLEEQDNQRHYVLESLRNVCKKEMGWLEENEPHLENTDDLASPLLYEVDTFSTGKMTFRLTLEGIKINSPISNNEGKCYKDFNLLSEELKKFGVITKFERKEAPDEDPKLIQKGELDLPDEVREMEMEA